MAIRGVRRSKRSTKAAAKPKAAKRSTRKLTAEGQRMERTFAAATRLARNRAFQKQRTLLVERDGWLVRVNKAGKVVKRVKELERIKLPLP